METHTIRRLRMEELECRRMLNAAPVANHDAYDVVEDTPLAVGTVADTLAGLVHRWTFDEQTGNIAHDSENGNDGTLLNWSGGEAKWVSTLGSRNQRQRKNEPPDYAGGEDQEVWK